MQVILLFVMSIMVSLTSGYLNHPSEVCEEYCLPEKTTCSLTCRRNHLFNKLRFLDCSRTCKSSYLNCCDKCNQNAQRKKLSLQNRNQNKQTHAVQKEIKSLHVNKGETNITNIGKAQGNHTNGTQALTNHTEVKEAHSNSTTATQATSQQLHSWTAMNPTLIQEQPMPPGKACSIVCTAERYTCQRECQLTPYDFGCKPECDVDYYDCERDCQIQARFHGYQFGR